MKPTPLPEYKTPNSWRMVLYWTLIYAACIGVVILDCVVWRP